MSQGSILLDGLAETDREWLFATAVEHQLEPGSALIQEGELIDQLHFVLRGFLEVSASNLGRLASMGEGEIVGEMSFVERRPAVARVTAPEGAIVLSIPFEDLDQRVATDEGFAGRWYRGIARLISRRHRSSMGKAEPDRTDAAKAAEAGPREIPGWWRPVMMAAQPFIKICERSAAESGKLPDNLARELREPFHELCAALASTLAGEGAENSLVRDELGRRLREDLFSHLCSSDLLKRILDRPRGISGDYLTMQAILERTATGRHGLGPALDRAFLDLPVCDAFRERARMMSERILIAARDRKEPLRVTCLAAGPADELFEVYMRLKNPALLKTTLIDLDSQAVLYMSGKRDNRFLEPHMELLNENVLYLAAGRSRLSIPPQDIIYSLNLLGSQEEGAATGILNFMHGILRPGGVAILGTFLPENPSRAFMEHILEWRLIHRTVNEMNGLFAKSLFNRPCTRIRLDDHKISALAECAK